MTTIARTLADIAPHVSQHELQRAVAEADFRRSLDIPTVEDLLTRGRAGGRTLRSAVERHRPELARTRSVLEERFLALCESAGVETPEVNVHIAGLMVDALWRAGRVVVELDGHVAHGTRSAIERDRRRELALRKAGYLVLRYTWSQVVREAEVVVADLRAALS